MKALTLIVILCTVCISDAQVFLKKKMIASAGASPVSSGIVGQIFSDDFDRASLGTDWKVNGLVAYTTNNLQLFVHGNTNLNTSLLFTNAIQTSTLNWEIRWSESNLTYDAHSPGAGVGIHALNGTGRDFMAIFSADNGADGRKIAIYEVQGGTWTLLVQSSQITYSLGDITDQVFTRTNDTLIATVTNRSNGSGQSTTTKFLYSGTGAMPPGPTEMAVYCYKGNSFIDSIVVTNLAAYPAPLMVVGDSITEGLSATAWGLGYEGMLKSNKTYAVWGYAGSSACVTNFYLFCTNEMKRYQASKILMMVGGNDIQFAETEANTENKYTNLVNILAANGATVIHALPTPRNTVDLTTWKNFLKAQYPSSYIDTWSPLTNGTHNLLAAYDSGDGVHPNAAGHLVVFQAITNSPLITP